MTDDEYHASVTKSRLAGFPSWAAFARAAIAAFNPPPKIDARVAVETPSGKLLRNISLNLRQLMERQEEYGINEGVAVSLYRSFERQNPAEAGLCIKPIGLDWKDLEIISYPNPQ